MASTTQIIPQYAFPYVETHITDYTELEDDEYTSEYVDPTIPYLFAFGSTKGIDNRWVLKRTQVDFVRTFGTPNFKKYGQSNLTAYNCLEDGQTRVWCYRCMPEDATRSHAIIDMYYRADTADDVENAHERKFRIKFTKRVVSTDDETYGPIINASDLDIPRYLHTVEATDGEYLDAEGYTEVPGVIVYTCNGRGTGGDSYSVRISNDVAAEKEYETKMYYWEILCSDTGLIKEEQYVGSLVSSVKYSEQTFINDVLADTDEGVAAVNIDVDESLIEEAYNAYVEWLTALHTDLADEYETLLESSDVTEDMVTGAEAYTNDLAETVELLREIDEMYTDTDVSEIPAVEEWDPIFGYTLGETDSYQIGIYFPVELTDDIDTTAEDYLALDYTSTEIVSLTAVRGITLEEGENGSFDNPGTKTVVNKYGVESEVQLTFQDLLDEQLIAAYSGTYDKRILSAKRIPCDALFDCNYSYDVKCAMAELALARDDCLFYLDTGIHTTLGTNELKSLISTYSQFDNRLFSKNIHHYITKDPITKKRITVTITYFLAQEFWKFRTNYLMYYPWVKARCQLSGHVKNSLLPTIEDYETSLKEKLVANRFNYFEVVEDNVFQRATQNTGQSIDSDLLEESNMHVLYYAKRIIEEDIRERLYDFNEAAVRQEFTVTEMSKFAAWNGSYVESIDIRFKANSWELKRSILHCYVEIVFRGLFKRAIVEIDINKRDYAANADED